MRQVSTLSASDLPGGCKVGVVKAIASRPRWVMPGRIKQRLRMVRQQRQGFAICEVCFMSISMLFHHISTSKKWFGCEAR